MRKLSFFYLSIIMFFISCTKQSLCEKDEVNPKIEVLYPIDNPVIRAGEPLCMKVLIRDNQSLMNVWLQVNDGHGFKKNYPVIGMSMEINEKYIAPVGVKGNLSAKFFAMDEVGNFSSQEIKFAVNN